MYYIKIYYKYIVIRYYYYKYSFDIIFEVQLKFTPGANHNCIHTFQ